MANTRKNRPNESVFLKPQTMHKCTEQFQLKYEMSLSPIECYGAFSHASNWCFGVNENAFQLFLFFTPFSYSNHQESALYTWITCSTHTNDQSLTYVIQLCLSVQFCKCDSYSSTDNHFSTHNTLSGNFKVHRNILIIGTRICMSVQEPEWEIPVLSNEPAPA